MREIVLIDISGRDRPGITMGLTEVLARYDVTVLDIGQSVIHNTLALGLLVELPDDGGGCPVFRELLFKAHELGLDLRFTPVARTPTRLGAGARPAAAYRHAARARDQRGAHRPRRRWSRATGSTSSRSRGCPGASRAGRRRPEPRGPRAKQREHPALAQGAGAGHQRPARELPDPGPTWTWTSPSRRTTSSAATAGWSASTWTRP
jgi:predicted amino acid-binding ACT domain protein